jgi:uncharacterized protein (UPF0332 family)
MLDLRRIRKSEQNVKAYLEEGLLKEKPLNRQILAILLKNARESLRVADELHKKNLSDLWVIVCSYYSMFYYASAILLKLGYKAGDRIVHKVTSDALIVYVRKNHKESLIEEYESAKEDALNLAAVKADSLIESFDSERNKRSLIQYNTIEIDIGLKSHYFAQQGKRICKGD